MVARPLAGRADGIRENERVSETISVAMVTFNGARFVRQQLDSIILQEPRPDEIVIGDDGSTDGTVETIRSVTGATSVPVRLIEGAHVGLRGNVERTLAACAGDVIVLADQDDVWMPGKLRGHPHSVRASRCDHVVLGRRARR